jgi:hypothetical protein
MAVKIVITIIIIKIIKIIIAILAIITFLKIIIHVAVIRRSLLREISTVSSPK